jgi:hypothetical protein
MKFRLFFLVLLPVLFSCTTQDICDDDNQSILVARFKSMATGKVTDTIVPDISIYGIREHRNDSLLYDSIDAARIMLPLDPGNPTSRFVITAGGQRDTLFIHHAIEAYLISYNCGFAALFTFDSLDYSGAIISDAEIISATIDAEMETDEEHLWIYF